jgi:hypothetical protein
MHRKLLIYSLLSLCSCPLSAQGGEDVYQFLNLPASVSAAGVGGNSVSSMESDLNLTFHNPAILSTEMNNDFSVGYMRYIADINVGTAAYARRINDRSVWMAGVRYVDYGSMLWTTAEDEILGNTYAQDLALTGAYSWMLTPYWRAGGAINLVYSVLDEYTSVAVAVDLGLYYHDPEKRLSAGVVVRSLGAQILSYNGTYESLPLDVQVGVTKKLAHAPFRFTLTAQNLLGLNDAYLKREGSTGQDQSTSDDFVTVLFKHLVGGVEFVPSDKFLLSLGYDYRRKSELEVVQRTPFSGFSAGFSMRFNKVRVGASFARYHLSGNCLQMTLGMNMSKFGI